jgi:hypothetical protein
MVSLHELVVTPPNASCEQVVVLMHWYTAGSIAILSLNSFREIVNGQVTASTFGLHF